MKQFLVTAFGLSVLCGVSVAQTSGTIPKFTDSAGLDDSIIVQNRGSVGIGLAPDPTVTLSVNNPAGTAVQGANAGGALAMVEVVRPGRAQVGRGFGATVVEAACPARAQVGGAFVDTSGCCGDPSPPGSSSCGDPSTGCLCCGSAEWFCCINDLGPWCCSVAFQICDPGQDQPCLNCPLDSPVPCGTSCCPPDSICQDPEFGCMNCDPGLEPCFRFCCDPGLGEVCNPDRRRCEPAPP